MTWTSTLLLCAASSAAVAVPLLFRLSAVKAQRDLYRAWWERDSARAIVAEAENDLTRQQRIDAGRQSHKAERALFATRTELLKQCVAARDADQSKPETPMTVPGFPADLSAGRESRRKGPGAPHHTGQDTGAAPLADVTPRVTTGNEPGHACRRNRAGYSASAEFSPEAKGAI